jgi:uracil-DNA glycosylase family 4
MGLGPTWRLRESASIAESADAVHQAPEPSLRHPTPDTRAEHAPRHPTPDTRGGDGRRAAIMLKEWPALKADVAACTACALHARRNKTVFGIGDENADWLFVGEGPGAEEDAQGEPFVGQAGRLLDNMLAAIRLKRGENVYIANVVKCRPPGNRNPEPVEALSCEPYLHRQIDLIRPKLIVALGKVAAANLLASDASVASMRGRVHEYRGTPLIVTYHPAYLLRTLADKAKAWEDLCFAVRTMAGLQAQARSTHR